MHYDFFSIVEIIAKAGTVLWLTGTYIFLLLNLINILAGAVFFVFKLALTNQYKNNWPEQRVIFHIQTLIPWPKATAKIFNTLKAAIYFSIGPFLSGIIYRAWLGTDNAILLILAFAALPATLAYQYFIAKLKSKTPPTMWFNTQN